jgi:hypothetical protein
MFAELDPCEDVCVIGDDVYVVRDTAETASVERFITYMLFYWSGGALTLSPRPRNQIIHVVRRGRRKASWTHVQRKHDHRVTADSMPEARLVAGGCAIDPPPSLTYANVGSLEGVRIAIMITKEL